MERVHANSILQVHMQRGKFYSFEWKESSAAKGVRNTNFLAENEKNYVLLRNNLLQYKNIFQYIYLNVFPEIYYAIERRRFDLKSTFHIIFETYKDKKKLNSCEKTLKITKMLMLRPRFLNKNQ